MIKTTTLDDVRSLLVDASNALGDVQHDTECRVEFETSTTKRVRAELEALNAGIDALLHKIDVLTAPENPENEDWR